MSTFDEPLKEKWREDHKQFANDGRQETKTDTDGQRNDESTTRRGGRAEAGFIESQYVKRISRNQGPGQEIKVVTRLERAPSVTEGDKEWETLDKAGKTAL